MLNKFKEMVDFTKHVLSVEDWNLEVFIASHGETRFPRLFVISTILNCWVTGIKCIAFGHNITESYVDVENGCSELFCEDCGYSYGARW